MRTLAPLRLKPSYWTDIEAQIIETLRHLLFKPLVSTIKAMGVNIKENAVLQNAYEDEIVKALRSGRLQYSNGVFSGTYSAAITSSLRKLGATFDERSRTFRIPPAQVPNWMKAEAAAYQVRARDIHETLMLKLREMERRLDHDINIRPMDAKKTIDALEDGFSPVAKKLEVSPELNPESRENLAEEYSENMKLYIKKFAEREVLSLREAVEENATEGYRFDKLIPSIKKRYGVSVRKAKFLARNETSIFMSKYHEQRYREGGVTQYVWSTSHDTRVRPALGTHGSDNHRVLDGRVFAFSNPPTVDPAKGRKANPGQDYNCRCVAIPVLGDKKTARAEYRKVLAEAAA